MHRVGLAPAEFAWPGPGGCAVQPVASRRPFREFFINAQAKTDPTRRSASSSLNRCSGSAFFDRFAEAVFLVADFFRVGGAEVFRGELVADFELAALEGGLLGPGDRLFHAGDIPNPIAGDEVAPVAGKRSGDDRRDAVVELDARRADARVEAGAVLHDAGLHELLVVGAHREHELRRGDFSGFRVGVGFDENEYLHRSTVAVAASPGQVSLAGDSDHVAGARGRNGPCIQVVFVAVEGTEGRPCREGRAEGGPAAGAGGEGGGGALNEAGDASGDLHRVHAPVGVGETGEICGGCGGEDRLRRAGGRRGVVAKGRRHCVVRGADDEERLRKRNDLTHRIEPIRVREGAGDARRGDPIDARDRAGRKVPGELGERADGAARDRTEAVTVGFRGAAHCEADGAVRAAGERNGGGRRRRRGEVEGRDAVVAERRPLEDGGGPPAVDDRLLEEGARRLVDEGGAPGKCARNLEKRAIRPAVSEAGEEDGAARGDGGALHDLRRRRHEHASAVVAHGIRGRPDARRHHGDRRPGGLAERAAGDRRHRVGERRCIGNAAVGHCAVDRSVHRSVARTGIVRRRAIDGRVGRPIPAVGRVAGRRVGRAGDDREKKGRKGYGEGEGERAHDFHGYRRRSPFTTEIAPKRGLFAAFRADWEGAPGSRVGRTGVAKLVVGLHLRVAENVEITRISAAKGADDERLWERLFGERPAVGEGTSVVGVPFAVACMIAASPWGP
ncbi:hypothetical protein OUZ56_032357 [Daphnia magna]|uniref:Uncharacterized protein n=1 Tax=Daphnia magna TaxID=35525 RepID=A0ABR0B8N7_9CRUS|nr:hypothetical protein OUZ56_032357 [Daphnia magna]